MDPRRKPADRTYEEEGGPAIEPQDWDALEGAEILPDSVAVIEEDGSVEQSGDLPGEDDDNPDQDSDNALPEDDEERAIGRRLGGQGIHYDPE